MADKNKIKEIIEIITMMMIINPKIQKTKKKSMCIM